MAAAALQAQFPGVSNAFKVKDELAAGKTDVYSIDGSAGDKIVALVKTADDTGTATSTLEPVVAYLGIDGTTPVDDTSLVGVACSTPTTCGASCPTFTRRFPFTGTFFLAVTVSQGSGCGSGA